MNVAFSRPPNFSFQAVRTRAFLEFVEGGPRAKITSVLAPPGFGKTILLVEIHHQVEREGLGAIWIGADAHTGTGTSFLFELEQRLLTPEPGFGEAFAYQQKPSTRERIERVVAALGATTGDLYIILDNADLGDIAETQRLIDALVFGTPDSIRLVISSSTRPPFDVTRSLLELRLKSIGAAELGFALTDIQTLFEEAGVSNLDRSFAAQILRLSEGWPAAVRLMQVLISAGGAALTGESEAWGGESLLESLFERLMERLQPDLQTFLIEISAFSAFSQDLLAVATQSSRSGAFLRYLIENNVLIASLSDGDKCFRLHALFRRYLSRLASDRLPPERRRDIALRGAQWLEREDHIPESLELALQANDAAMCVRLLEKLSWTLVRRAGNLASFTGWVELARSRDIQLGSEARFWYLWTLIFDRRYDDAARELESFTDDLRHTSCSEERRTMLQAKVGLAELVLKLHLDDMGAIRSLAPKWLEHHAEMDRFETGATAGALALAQVADLDFNAAHQSARLSIGSVSPSASLYGKSWAKNIWAHLELMLGNAAEVDARTHELQETIRREIGHDSLIGAVTAMVRANALYHLGQEGEAVAIADGALSLASQCGLLDFVWLGLEAMLRRATNPDADPGALNVLYETAERYPERLTRMLDYQRIRLLCYDNRPEAAIQLASKVSLWTNSEVVVTSATASFASETMLRDLAAINLMTIVGDHEKAADRIEAGLHRARQANNRRAWIDYLLARCGFSWRIGRSHEAASAFSRAVVLASEAGWKSPFREQAALARQIVSSTPLKQLGLVTDASRTFLSEITEVTVAPLTEDEGPDLRSEGLTKRELALLHMLNEGKDNAQIAQNANIAVRTVKWHLRNLYAKLDVKNRTAALARARGIGLI